MFVGQKAHRSFDAASVAPLRRRVALPQRGRWDTVDGRYTDELLMTPKTIFFNSSLPRSGSTLMQNILAQNPQFYCSPTSGVIGALGMARAQYSENETF